MKRDNQFYYVRHIPSDLTHHYSVQRICFSLKTKSDSTAVRFSKSITQRLDDYWFGMRLKNMNVPAGDKIKLDGAINDDDTPKISDALDLYLRLKGAGKDKVFFRTAKRNIRYVIKVLGNKSLKSYSSSDGGKFRDWLLEEGMSVNTVKRVFSSIRSIINIAISEYGLDCSNGFARTYFPNDNIEIRKPIPTKDIKHIQSLCREYDDDLRWLIAILSETGMRLGEGVGLLKSDINLNCKTPHIKLVPHPWRRLKTKGSQRCIPLVGASLWACERILEHNNDSIYAFPRYTSVSICNANSASAALNKWMKEKLSDSYVIHGFRHSMRDRLRAVECPSDIIDKIGGWITAGVGQSYGQGFPLEVISKWMNKI